MTDLSIKNLSYVDNFKHTVMGNFANFKGRASRSEYWRFYGITIVIAGIINVLSALFMNTALSSVFGLISMAYNVAILLPSIGLGVRRFHDVGKSGWMLLISLIPFGIIYVIFLFGFNLCKGIPYLNVLVRYHISDLLVLLLIWLYALLVDFSPSVLRSATMITVYSVVRLLNRDRSSLNTLALTAIILLVLHPQNLWDVGFQLSFMAVLSIILFAPTLYGLFSYEQLQHHWLLRWIWTLITVSVAAQLGTAPLVAYYFGRFSCYFLLSNFIVIPCATIILYTTVLLFVCFFMPVAQLFIGKALQTIVGAMNTALHSIAHLPGASIEELHPSILQLFFCYVLLLCAYCLTTFFSKQADLQ